MNKETPTTIYFAGPLFTQGEWQWNNRICELLENKGLKILLPQRRAEPMLSGKESFNPQLLFEDNVSQIDKCDVVVAIFDQADPDSGTCWECGYAFRLGVPILGVRTDLRKAGDDPESSINLMLSKSCKKIIELPFAKRAEEEWLANEIVQTLKGIE